MTLNQKMNEMSSRTLLRYGMVLFLAGIALANIHRLNLGLSDFWNGFAVGVAVVMIGTSIAFNIRSLTRARAERRK
jgi:hypothetical protein